jgi:nickel/cobalt exporter
MTSFNEYLRTAMRGFTSAAIVLGALHALEPGHSKTMMAAFIVAIRGTVWQPRRAKLRRPRNCSTR